MNLSMYPVFFISHKVCAKDSSPGAAALLLAIFSWDRRLADGTGCRARLGAPQRALEFTCLFLQSVVKAEPVCKSGFQQGS